jgi:hypothetical protein
MSHIALAILWAGLALNQVIVYGRNARDWIRGTRQWIGWLDWFCFASILFILVRLVFLELGHR